MKIKKSFITSMKVGLVSLTAALLVTPSLALAYSGFGSGTQAKPFRITTCAQLGEMTNNVAGYYVLNNDIDCGGTTFTPVSSTFTGTLDGQNHTIKNINFTTCGIFCNAGPNATIENLNVSDGTFTSSTYGSSIGTFVGEADGVTLNNLHSNLTMTGSSGDQYIGGIVGLVWQGTNTITNSSYTGSITVPGSDGYVGGIAGYAGGLSTYSFSNDYAASTISLTSSSSYQSAGGFIGDHSEDSITDSYSAGSITSASTSYNYVGGFAGLFDGSIQNSFSATAVSGVATYIGAVYGNSGGTNTNMYFDESRATLSSCSGDGVTSCTAVNASGNQASYFFNNKTNAPLSSWDFNNTWALSSSYPILQNQALFTISDNIPNSGDANNDGSQDVYQPNVADVIDAANVWATITIPSTSGCIIGDGSSVSSASLKIDTGHTALTNPVDFNIYCPTAGATVPVTIIYDRQYANPTLVFYNTATQTYTSVAGAQFSTVTIGGIAKTEVTYSVTDGGVYDSDGNANGVIADPVGLVGPQSTVAVSAPATGFGAPSQNSPTIDLLVTIAIISMGSGLVLLNRHKFKP